MEFSEIEIDGSAVKIEIRSSTRANRLSMRVPSHGGLPIVTFPARETKESAIEFVQKNKGWLRERLKKRLPPVPFEVGALVPFRGEEHLISNDSETRGTVSRIEEENGLELRVHGDPQFLSRRLTDWFKSQAGKDIEEAVDRYSNLIGKKPSKVIIGDQKSLWGSCIGKRLSDQPKKLAFSWRLIMMPRKILEYVVAHEVAHIIEMNHSIRFWKLTRQLCDHTDQSRDWLRVNGSKYHLYGLARD